jgi:uncharacterized protein (DUF1800 family)
MKYFHLLPKQNIQTALSSLSTIANVGFIVCALSFNLAHAQTQSVSTNLNHADSLPNNLFSKQLQPTSINATLLLNRVTWGANASSAATLNSMGMTAYLQQQLQAKNSVLPSAVQAQIDAMTISTIPFTRMMFALEEQREKAAKLKDTDNQLSKEYRQELNRIYIESASRSLLRSMYSDNQLYEQMNWFWMNHFNISNRKGNVRAMLGDFEEQAIRPHALGNFHDLLRATLLHPAMLRYLDNEHNAVDRINENYARELMELHTMGVDSGYTQNDVQELARVLTGLGVKLRPDNPRPRRQVKLGFWRNGITEFNPDRHDFGDKKLLGNSIKGEGVAELDKIIDILVKQPATAHFISQKLAVYFVSDTPSKELVNAMAATFLKSNADIPSVLRTLFFSAEFANSLGTKFKDPLHYVISSMRLAYDYGNDQSPIINTQPILRWMNELGQEPNGHQTPDGYSMKESAWSSPAQMTSRFDIAKIIARGSPQLFKTDDSEMRIKVRDLPQPSLANAEYVKTMTQQFSDNTKNALLQTQSKQEWNTLFLASPEMMRR